MEHTSFTHTHTHAFAQVFTLARTHTITIIIIIIIEALQIPPNANDEMQLFCNDTDDGGDDEMIFNPDSQENTFFNSQHNTHTQSNNNLLLIWRFHRECNQINRTPFRSGCWRICSNLLVCLDDILLARCPAELKHELSETQIQARCIYLFFILRQQNALSATPWDYKEQEEVTRGSRQNSRKKQNVSATLNECSSILFGFWNWKRITQTIKPANSERAYA